MRLIEVVGCGGRFLQSLRLIHHIICMDSFFYDELDDNIADFMSRYGGWISSVTGDNCWITIFENPEWDDYWKDRVKEVYGEDYKTVIKNWIGRDSSYSNMSHKIADKLDIPMDLFPCVIFLKSVDATSCTKPYPLINDKKFYRKFFSVP